ncbi:MAG: hypothetical protein KDA68_07405 [Planctomycetaceae bacterium]|nr:hypothetical protein [Planctomycetaceae bacterium]MCA9097502.1 hypothetical protein [Planctomycetaceae bacterium]
MLKIINTILISLCIATVLSEVVGIALLWQRGQLTSQTLQDIRLVLRGEKNADEKEPEDADAPQISLEDELVARAKVASDFENRHRTLNNFEKMIWEKADQTTVVKQSVEAIRTQFLTELEELRKKNFDEATEQGRGILMALPPEEAARKLMQLTLEEDLILLKGISEKKIADILQEMVDPEAAKRGQEIFQKLSTGGLVDKLVQETKSKLEPTTGASPSGN